MKQFTSSLFILFFTLSVNAQKQWSVYSELLGSGEIYSLNGTYQFTKCPSIGIRLGAMYIKDFDPTIRTIHHLNYIFGSRHAVEFGIGVTTNIRFRPSLVKGSILPSATIMYRYQGNGGWFFRGGITPTLTGYNHKSNTFNIKPLHYLYPGIGFGYSFGK
ncbi:hypothetical protein [Crocinitomix catalasitica]|uniref:hypothetical protein n=1 Tax=Crocinitomix catalasitica TaxID=184607 RepID=UPI0004832C91|nr:hypothetical protein [Crocinitomix catalasitica]